MQAQLGMKEMFEMTARIASSLAATAILLALGVGAAASASAVAGDAQRVDGSIGLCFTIPVGSADLVWCL
ncbi:hypothetical protein KHQ06_22425 [Nocardia tengchongensis]|uniref:Uncharacterized protein n=2 Tax=Nocardia tengchongensis TaxID=2055889 RepID=A0ABX8D2V1_9NOCA|nr:hypothetical protein [Nocardia tengchongensis]QVI25419.1 hypothetical protein KHQ06_22425 [Nocardia tengchongensis]